MNKPIIAIVAILATLSLATAKLFFAVTTIGAVALTWTVVLAPLLVYLVYIAIVLIAAIIFSILSALFMGFMAWWISR